MEGSELNLVGKISTSPRYGSDIIGTDLLSLGELEGGLILKNRKNEVFLAYKRVIVS